MASSQPPSRGANKVSDNIWRDKLEANEDKMVDVLRICSDTIVQQCIKAEIIREDKDISAFKKMKPKTRIKEIIALVFHGDRQMYEQFREIIRKENKVSLYEELNIEKKDGAAQCTMASSQPAGTTSRLESDEIWKEWLKDKEKALVDGLRLYQSIVVTKCKDEKILKDKDVSDIKKQFDSEMKIRKIVHYILQGNRKTYERFRKILKDCKQTALYDLLEVKQKAEPEQIASKGTYSDLVDAVYKSNKQADETSRKMDSLMDAMSKMQKTQAEEVDYLKTLLKQRDEECNKQAKRIAELEEELKQTRRSRHEIERLENELNEKQKAYLALEKKRDGLRKRLRELEMNVGSEISESSR